MLTETDVNRSAHRQKRYDDLMEELVALLASRDRLFAGGQGPQLAPTAPTPSIVG